MDSFLREQAFAGARQRYGRSAGKSARPTGKRTGAHRQTQIRRIFFDRLGHRAIFAAQQDIMAQGRGSAANSTVCFCLGITAVDPLRFNTLFERFSDRRPQEQLAGHRY